ncbi:orotate phosphoribosyltransferase-like protein [Methanocella arvoryzae]|uniref:Transcriptional regulator GfcR n=1 Tax=Methanocella arvoryzae (strain DSM 22066 / NBRC 105507 / MRE50) TaxID=351160 RepID=GFCR_METAR|nr:orotate phosphoribosyltransferase-like protein [Methanocella arvoryzae]Q0W2K2.1 RecName: Full=PyrE-like protein [Methanocella arvoryzae MRE50]CAJ37391.1 putative orotate phosphoribosyltransferase [Methanocella arvoryzae MRE50]
MKNVNDLIEKAIELRNRGLRSGEIADELNISRETATWLLTRARKETGAQAPKDIFIDWSTIGKSSSRLMLIATCMADMVEEVLNEMDTNVDVVVGIALSGVPLANVVAYQYGVDLAVIHPGKHRSDDTGKHHQMQPTVSENYANVKGKRCVIIDDVITTGSTMEETIKLIEDQGGEAVAIAVIIDKRGADTISNVPVKHLIRIGRVD